MGIGPTVLALVGEPQGYRVHTDVVQLNDTTAVELTKMGIDTTSIVVKGRFTNIAYTVGNSDFVVTTDDGEDSTGGTADDVTSIARDSGGDIPNNEWVTVTYEYTDPDYYKVWRHNSQRDVVELYGPGFNDDGTLNSPLTLAAELAFTNGAYRVVTVGVEKAGSEATTQEWTDTINKLANEIEPNVLVVVTGDTAIHAVAKNFVNTQVNLGIHLMNFFGLDGVTDTVSEANIKSAATGHQDSRVVVVAPATAKYYHSSSVGEVEIGGQYVAAALAGNFGSRQVQVPLTRKIVRGFTDVDSPTSREDLEDLQRSGVCVVAKKRTGGLYVRHGLTTDMSNRYTQEISIQAASDRLQELVLDTLEKQNLIGEVLTELTPSHVVQAITGALEIAQTDGLITGYSAVEYRIPNTSPTLIQARFQYLPSLPLNYIEVQFTMDPTAGTADFVTTTSTSPQ